MNKQLPKTNNSQGFTLIELLVVIAIIAVLSIVAFSIFTGLTGRANDSRRNADIKAYADAMEVKRSNVVPPSSVYVPVVPTDFSGGTFPTEPTSRAEKYCYQDGIAAIGNTSVASWASLTSGCPSGWANVSGTAPTVAATATYFKFCTINEAKTAVICQGSKQ